MEKHKCHFKNDMYYDCHKKKVRMCKKGGFSQVK